MPALATKRGRPAGFTLIELSAVILIAGILAAMSVPTFLPVLGKSCDFHRLLVSSFPASRRDEPG